MKAENIKGIYDISGFGKDKDPEGRAYEEACQKMLQAGYEWLVSHKIASLDGHTYKNIYGIFEPDSKDAKEMSKVICKACPDGATGAMHQAVMQHLFYIAKYGLEKWKKADSERGR